MSCLPNVKITLTELAKKACVTIINLSSILKTGKAKGARFEPLKAICKAIGGKPGDIIDVE